jgi:hypothetical protein
MKLHKLPNKKNSYTCHFDFDIGYLVKSPCRCCDRCDDLPHCAKNCRLIDDIRGRLADAIPCTQRN